MKRAVIITIIVGLFGWIIYDFIAEDDIEDHTVIETPGEIGVEGDFEFGIEKGMHAPDFELETLDGDVVRLSDFRGEKVLLNFWATWCPPCRAEMPDMQKFHEDKDVVILAVDLTSTETDLDNIPEFVEEFGVTFRILLDENDRVASLYEIQPIPTSYLIDSEGIVHNMAVGALNYDMMVQEFEKMD